MNNEPLTQRFSRPNWYISGGNPKRFKEKTRHFLSAPLALTFFKKTQLLTSIVQFSAEPEHFD
jgi:hypothetical protein